MPRELAKLRALVTRSLERTADLWPTIRVLFGWVHAVAAALANEAEQSGDEVRAAMGRVLATMRAARDTVGSCAQAVDHFLKVTASYAPGLYHCYQVDGLPRTNNALEQYFGAARYHERRASGRKGAIPSLVVRGSVRVVAAVATQTHTYAATDLAVTDPGPWRDLRASLERRGDVRRHQLRFRRDPEAYLRSLEDRLLKPSLPS